tara:strand:+ start:266 stop:484 length:219 start_codon:yes stop_codon:yes gene_type:complete
VCSTNGRGMEGKVEGQGYYNIYDTTSTLLPFTITTSYYYYYYLLLFIKKWKRWKVKEKSVEKIKKVKTEKSI